MGHELKDWGTQPAHLQRVLPDGRVLVVEPLLFGQAKLGLTSAEELDDPFGGYFDVWEYPSLAAAVGAMHEWDPGQSPEPAGWTRHPGSGRRRPDGDPGNEYVHP